MASELDRIVEKLAALANKGRPSKDKAKEIKELKSRMIDIQEANMPDKPRQSGSEAIDKLRSRRNSNVRPSDIVDPPYRRLTGEEAIQELRARRNSNIPPIGTDMVRYVDPSSNLPVKYVDPSNVNPTIRQFVPSADPLRQFAGQSFTEADYSNADRVRGRMTPQYTNQAASTYRNVPSGLGYSAQPVNMSPLPPRTSFSDYVPTIKKDPISVTGTTEGDKKLNTAIKDEIKKEETIAKVTEKASNSGEAADKKTGGLFSKLKETAKAVKPTAGNIGAGLLGGYGGAGIGSAIEEAVFGTSGRVGGFLGGIAGSALALHPATRIPALVGSGIKLGYDILSGGDEPKQVQQEVAYQEPQAREASSLEKALDALVKANTDVTNMRAALMNRTNVRGDYMQNFDPNLLR